MVIEGEITPMPLTDPFHLVQLIEVAARNPSQDLRVDLPETVFSFW